MGLALGAADYITKPISHDEAVRGMREGRGKHFDPEILDAFLAIEEQFRTIACRYRADSDSNGVSSPIY